MLKLLEHLCSRSSIPKTGIFLPKMLAEIDVKTPKSIAAVKHGRGIGCSCKRVGFPIIIRAAYTLGGLGSGFCENDEELKALGIKSIFLFSTNFG